MNLLDSFTIERLEELADENTLSNMSFNELLSLAKIALAAKQAKPDFDEWLKDNFPSTYRMAFEYEPQDDDDEELVNHFKASIIDMRAGWDGAIKSNYPQIPEGWILVPQRLTQNMAEAAKCTDGRLSTFKYDDVYCAMLAAAPKP